ncbi:GNAT family N-acetyltransferase [Streptomyces sp. NBC_00075]|uniref:GNAT family N-acetyltransferase n=1 Tax=Streptomyces sp. NBC_00075 TaxID=2975641 RepID=UPI0038639B61
MSLFRFGRLALDPHQQRAATFEFALRPNTWGVGYGLDTVRLLLGVGFDELGLHRVWGTRSPLNKASTRTAVNGPSGLATERLSSASSTARGASRTSSAESARGLRTAQ